MAFRYLQSVIVLVQATLIFRSANGDVYYVAPNVTDCNVNASCNTLSYYANSTTLQLRGSVFYFMPGTHLLQQTWVLDNASNLILAGPNEADAEAVVECPLPNNGHGIRVINGRNVTVKMLKIFHCQQGVDRKRNYSSSLFSDSTNKLQLSGLNIGFSGGSCLHMINCPDYIITESTFTSCYRGISIEGVSSGKLTSIALRNNSNGIYAYDQSRNITSTIQLSMIIASNNSQTDFSFVLCSARISLWTATSINSGGFFAGQSCDQADTYAIEMINCSFSALKGGIGICLSHAQTLEISMNSCSFSNTSGYFRYSLIDVCHAVPILAMHRTESKFVLQNVTIENIQATDNSKTLLHIGSFDEVVFTNVSFLNLHGGIELYDSVAVFHGTNRFNNNSAIYGGGMSLRGNSYLIMESNSTLELINNTAEKFGGGIFVSQGEPWSETYCFMQLNDHSTKVIFKGNKAGYTGSDLYGGHIESCQQLRCNLQLADVLGLRTNTSQCGQVNVSSDAMKLAFCDDQCISTNRTERYVSLYPGTQLSVGVAAIGQLDGLAVGNIMLKYDDVFDHDKKDESDFINITCTNIVRQILVNKSEIWGNISLTVSDDFLPSYLNKPITIVVNVLPCPAGFNFSDENRTCVCSDSIVDYAQCDIKTRTISRYGNSWISPTNESIMLFKHCPFDYCKLNTESFSIDSPDDQCISSRAGTLCGNCIQGYSLSLGSNRCLNCTHQVWRPLLIILGSALAGIALVAVLIGLNLTVSEGTINGFLFFINVVEINEAFFFCNKHFTVMRYFFSWLNLDLGISTCFFEGMNSCQKVGFQFVFPSYLLFLVLLIVAICRCGQWVVLRSLPWVVKISNKTALLMGSKIIPVLATLLLFCYTKVIRTIILIYNKADISVFDISTGFSHSDITSRWYVNGSVKYLTGCHWVLFGLGTGIVVPLVTLFTAFLLFFPLMEQHLPRFKFWTSWHMRLKPWYDAYGGPYKDEYRFWTGLLLVVRCLLVVVVTVDTDPQVASSVLIWLCLILIPLLALLQVYKSFILNVLEILYFACIPVMVYASTIQDFPQRYLVLIFSLCLLITIVLFHTRQCLKYTRFYMFFQQVLTKKKEKQRTSEKIHLDIKFEDKKHNGVATDAFSLEDFNELRESLLEHI